MLALHGEGTAFGVLHVLGVKKLDEVGTSWLINRYLAWLWNELSAMDLQGKV